MTDDGDTVEGRKDLKIDEKKKKEKNREEED